MEDMSQIENIEQLRDYLKGKDAEKILLKIIQENNALKRELSEYKHFTEAINRHYGYV